LAVATTVRFAGAQSVRLAPWHRRWKSYRGILHISMKRETKPAKCAPPRVWSLASCGKQPATTSDLPPRSRCSPHPRILDTHRRRCFDMFRARWFQVITQSRCRIRGQRVNLIVATERKICPSLSLRRFRPVEITFGNYLHCSLAGYTRLIHLSNNVIEKSRSRTMTSCVIRHLESAKLLPLKFSRTVHDNVNISCNTNL